MKILFINAGAMAMLLSMSLGPSTAQARLFLGRPPKIPAIQKPTQAQAAYIKSMFQQIGHAGDANSRRMRSRPWSKPYQDKNLIGILPGTIDSTYLGLGVSHRRFMPLSPSKIGENLASGTLSPQAVKLKVSQYRFKEDHHLKFDEQWKPLGGTYGIKFKSLSDMLSKLKTLEQVVGKPGAEMRDAHEWFKPGDGSAYPVITPTLPRPQPSVDLLRGLQN